MPIKLHVPDMSCGHCKATIEKTVGAADPLAELTFDMDARHVEVDSDLDLESLTMALETAGYKSTAL